MRISPVMNYSFSRKNTSGLNAQPVNYSKPSALSQNSEISNIPFTGWFGFQDKISKTLKIENIFKNGKAAGFIEYFDSNAGKKLQRKLETDEFGNFLADTRYVYKPNNRRNELLKTFGTHSAGGNQVLYIILDKNFPQYQLDGIFGFIRQINQRIKIKKNADSILIDDTLRRRSANGLLFYVVDLGNLS